MLLMIASSQTFVAHVAAHAGVSTGRADHATRTVLAGIAGYLSPALRELVADELPPALAVIVMEADPVTRAIDDLLIGRGVTTGQAYELLASVCRVVAEELSAEAIGALLGSLPIGIARMLGPVSPELGRRPPTRAQRDTLAAGRPGSRHPLSEAGPHGHADSIAAANPHADTKLSSASRSTHETLAEGRAGSRRTITGS